jgi:hypothetical protein
VGVSVQCALVNATVSNAVAFAASVTPYATRRQWFCQEPAGKFFVMLLTDGMEIVSMVLKMLFQKIRIKN